ncbi:lipocalin-like domain-containing protein [Pareuzebyella sediminis]|uniref:lipocalin family protein n=1 Tax=Pareuzebyella sediminis TaxID=2607998 RepID=UPI0011F052F0|nr:lipocalin family protein [Pareuzebyella sediminis]
MKKAIVLVTIVAFMASCSISKEVAQQRKTIDGTWTLENVGYEGSDGSFKAQLFNDAQAFCFEGSTWFFNNNNSTGTYTIPTTNSACSGGIRNIRWSVSESNMGNDRLMFKFIDEKKNDLYGGTGYGLDIVSLSPTQMTLKSNATVNGESIDVIYEFNKQ